MHLELNDEQTEVLIRELAQLIDNDRYFLGPRVRVLKEILGKLRPEPSATSRCPRYGITSRRRGVATAGADEALPRPADDARKRRCGQAPAYGLVQSMRSPE